jgi:hypothetical protein
MNGILLRIIAVKNIHYQTRLILYKIVGINKRLVNNLILLTFQRSQTIMTMIIFQRRMYNNHNQIILRFLAQELNHLTTLYKI